VELLPATVHSSSWNSEHSYSCPLECASPKLFIIIYLKI